MLVGGERSSDMPMLVGGERSPDTPMLVGGERSSDTPMLVSDCSGLVLVVTIKIIKID